ncbi:MAG: hypothetical protein MJB14_01535 [Spirochaetes bacterium]|nr:hypothetical protein [Spirochaetota bacterium]
MIPKEPTLSYNLACAHAVFKDKKKLLKYIKKSLASGKTTDQFMDNPDFLKVLNKQ